MKFFVLLLTVIVLTLTVMPCCAVEARDTYTHKAQKDNHQCPEKDNDCCKDCSPFYVCGRCTGFTVTKFKLFISAAVTIRPIVQNGIYLSAELPQILIPIWQPPQLS